MTTETIEVPPDVARISEGLRDTGYEFNTAIADIIDNSIAAGASTWTFVLAQTLLEMFQFQSQMMAAAWTGMV